MSMTKRRAKAITDGFIGKRVLVIGDLMADEHIWGHAARVSPEAPVLVLDVERQTFVPGGAANVANQLLAFGAKVFVAGVVGADGNGDRLKDSLAQLGANVEAIVTTTDRPTTTKTRIVAGAQQIVRVDQEKRMPLPDSVAAELIVRSRAALEACDAILFSDYTKGVLGRGTVSSLIEAAKKQGIVATANPKPSSARFYAGTTVAQFNRSEADQTLGGVHRMDAGSSETSFHAAGARLRETLEVENLLITRSAEGLTLFLQDGTHADILPHRLDVFDGTGAGDSTLSGVTLALTAGASLPEAAAIGNASGGAVVRKVGVVVATRDEVVTLFSPEVSISE